MITFEKFHLKNEKRTKSKVEISINTIFYTLLTISAVKARIPGTSSISKELFGEDISSFCVHEKCTVVFPNSTSVTLPLAEFHTFMTQYLDHKGSNDNNSNISHLNERGNVKTSIEKYEKTELDVTEPNLDIPADFLETPPTKNSASGQVIEQGNVQSHLLNSIPFPANEKNATEHTTTTICRICNKIKAFDDSNDTKPSINTTSLEDKNFTKFSFQNEHKIHSRSIPRISPKYDDKISLSANHSESTWVEETTKREECKDPKRISSDGVSVPTDGSGTSTTSFHHSSTTPPRTRVEIDYHYNDVGIQIEKPVVQVTEEEVEEAKKMTECAKMETKNGTVCVCNETYCDKFIPPDQTPKWIYTWYTSSKQGHRFRKLRNDLTPYKGDEDGAFYVNTSRRYQKIFGFGGAFTDTTCKLIKNLSKATKRNLLESYFGPFGINYNLGRVPIGGTDFSPRFYTYMDAKDESTATFMLTEQDFKYKIPILLEAIELTHNQLKLMAAAWSAPVWMKSIPQQFFGTLKREYFPLWAEYHLKFLDQYLTNGIKFWALSTGNEPMNYYYVTSPPYINAMEWSPYEQSQWVASYLHPMLKNSSHADVLLLGLEENREYITSFMKFFFEDYQLKSFDDPTYHHESRLLDILSGIAIHGYTDTESNLPYLQNIKDMFPNKFLIYTETCCFGAPQLGSWECGEAYATDIIKALNHWVVGWMDWNMALDPKGGPTFTTNVLNSPIVVDVNQDEFYKESTFYVMGHFSIFLLPNSYRVETKTPERFEEIYAVAAVRPDGGKVIVFYNKYETDKQVTFLIDKKYKISIKVPAKSMNSVLFW